MSHINLVIGLQGSGKTLWCIKECHKYWKAGYKIYSNVKLSFPFEQIDYDKIVNCEYTNAVIFIDELHRLLPSRRCLSKSSVAIVDGFLSMARKKNLIILGTTQLEYKVDVRYRDEATYWYKCIKFAYINNDWIQVMHNQKLDKRVIIGIEVTRIDMYQDDNRLKYAEERFIGNTWFDFYDTHEIIEIKGVNF